MRPPPSRLRTTTTFRWPNDSVALGGGLGTLWSTTDLVARVHTGTVADRAMNQLKGALGEHLMDRAVGRGLLSETGWSMATARSGIHGIDGLFFKLDDMGRPREMLVMEAKAFGARLAYTASGRQMSPSWMSSRLEGSSKFFAKLADALAGNNVRYVNTIPSGASIARIPIDQGRFAEVGQVGDRLYLRADDGVTASRVSRQLRDLARWAHEGSLGNVAYRSRIFRYDVVDGQHRFSIIQTDTALGAPSSLPQEVMGKFDDLPRHFQGAYREACQSTFRAMGKSEEEVKQLVQRACDDPEFLPTMHREAAWNWRMSLSAQAVLVAVASGAAAFALNAAAQWWARGEVDWVAATRMGLLYGGASFVGAVAGTNASARLLTTTTGRRLLSALPGRGAHATWSRTLGSGGGAAAALVFLTATQYILGLIDGEQAKRTLVANGAGLIAGAGFTGGAFASATLFGTAGTGTAISTLSGAAYTNAALAWMGGGTIATGGGGVALGTVVLTGGVAAAAVVASIGATYAYRLLDDTRARRLIAGRLQLTVERVASGRQPEWRTGHAQL